MVIKHDSEIPLIGIWRCKRLNAPTYWTNICFFKIKFPFFGQRGKQERANVFFYFFWENCFTSNKLVAQWWWPKDNATTVCGSSRIFQWQFFRFNFFIEIEKFRCRVDYWLGGWNNKILAGYLYLQLPWYWVAATADQIWLSFFSLRTLWLWYQRKNVKQCSKIR